MKPQISRGPLKNHFGGQANLFDSGQRQRETALASTKADLSSLPEYKNLLLAAGKQLLELPFKIVVLLIMLTAIPLALAEGQDNYKIAWSTIDSGGGRSSGGTYSVTGTIGQPDAGYMYGGSYEILSGFWTGGPLCVVNLDDFAKFTAYWLAAGPDRSADLHKDDDNIVNYLDLEVLISEWLYACPSDWPF